MNSTNATRETAIRLQHLATRMLRLARSQHGNEGVGSAQYSAMAVLYDRGPLSVVELARAEHVSHPTMSRVVAGLVKIKAAERLRDESDGRLHRVVLTARGRILYEQICAKRVSIMTAILDQLKPATARELLNAVSKVMGSIEEKLRQD